MNPETDHTQTPWEYREEGDANHYVILAAGKWLLTLLHNGEAASLRQRANMAFIVRAVNAHDDLVKALKELADFCENNLRPGPGLNEILLAADNALAKAKLQPPIIQTTCPNSGIQ